MQPHWDAKEAAAQRQAPARLKHGAGLGAGLGDPRAARCFRRTRCCVRRARAALLPGPRRAARAKRWRCAAVRRAGGPVAGAGERLACVGGARAVGARNSQRRRRRGRRAREWAAGLNGTGAPKCAYEQAVAISGAKHQRLRAGHPGAFGVDPASGSSNMCEIVYPTSASGQSGYEPIDHICDRRQPAARTAPCHR